MPAARVAVAVSGGRDSTALLHCTARWAREHRIEVLALHVHHGLMPDADAWQAHLQRQCRRWRSAGLPVTLHVCRIGSSPRAGASVEAWARDQRYQALARMAHEHDCDLVLLAHHREDQAETFLLQALRGGAPRGLAAMPVHAKRHGVHWVRPWLSSPRAAIEHYLTRHRLRWVDDPSNRGADFARSRLRESVWPVLQRAFPDAGQALSQAGRRAHEAACCLRELAEIDLATMFDGETALKVDQLPTLSGPRAANLLRHGLERLLPGQSVPQSLVDRLCNELPTVRVGRWPAPGGGELRLHGGRLRHCSDHARPQDRVDQALRLDLGSPGVVVLPGSLGTITVTRVEQGGVASTLLAQATLRQREGGERFQIHANSVPRSLKKQFQALRVPPWSRDGPLVFAGDRLLFVPGLGVDARAVADQGQAQMTLAWAPSKPGVSVR